MLVLSGSPNIVDNSSSSLDSIVPGNKVLSDFCSILETIHALMRFSATGCLYMEKIYIKVLAMYSHISVPAADHQFIYNLGTTRGWWESGTSCDLLYVLQNNGMLTHVAISMNSCTNCILMCR